MQLISEKKKLHLIKILITLLILNYMVVTILFKDNVILKYLRDILVLFGIVFCSNFNLKLRDCFIFILLIFFIYSYISSDNLAFSLVYLRRYLFPIFVFFLILTIGIKWNKYSLNIFCRFLISFLFLLSLWGIFQAHILGDSFLMKLGYNTGYLVAYGTEKLNHSFYFGGIGIQRVVSTLSNCNTFALVLGTSLIFIVGCYSIIEIKYKNFLLFVIVLAYILTFSRSNFLGFGVALIFVLYPYIPYKKYIFLLVFLSILSIFFFSIIQDKNSLINKLFVWVENSLSFTESSAAGRASRWADAINNIFSFPFGRGYGYVGSLARDSNVSDFVASENSYFAMCIDIGIIGAISYFGYLLKLIFTFEKRAIIFIQKGHYLYAKINRCSKAILLYLFVAMFFSNYIYGMEAISLIYIYLGISLSFSMDK